MIELDNAGLAPVDRFEWWCAQMTMDIVPTRITTETDDFRASARLLEMGSVHVSVLAFSQLRSVRTSRLIREADPEWWELSLITGGAMGQEQHGNTAHLRPGDLMLYDTSHPFAAESLSHDEPNGAVILHIPRRAMPLPDRALRDLASRSIPPNAGMGPVLAGFLRALGEQAETLQGTADRLGTAAVDIAMTFLADLVDARERLPRPTRRQALLCEIKAFIIRNLRRPDLTPGRIAAAHHISVRHLHDLFQRDEESGRTVAHYIRDHRLKRCRADLEDRALADRSVAEIGARWGFPDPVVFSRIFKKAYGMPPGEYRTVRRGLPASTGSPGTGSAGPEFATSDR